MTSQPIDPAASLHHSRRVESWVHEVINALIESIGFECTLLGRGNSTWRFYLADRDHQLEHIRPIAGYLSPSARHILRDFTRENGDARGHLGTHDRLLGEVQRAARAAHTDLVNRSGFRDRVADALREYQGFETDHPAGHGEAQFADQVAERVLNRIDSLPSQYVDSKFWRRFGPEFLALRTGPAFAELDEAVSGLLNADHHLLQWLEDKSFDLCKTYDVPAAPMRQPNS
ncbi:MAG: hypothetical protein WKG00_01605 [Polyangiaceae bacterium]